MRDERQDPASAAVRDGATRMSNHSESRGVRGYAYLQAFKLSVA